LLMDTEFQRNRPSIHTNSLKDLEFFFFFFFFSKHYYDFASF
jgi:hypothetical protein